MRELSGLAAATRATLSRRAADLDTAVAARRSDAVPEPLAGALGKGIWVVDHTTAAVRPTAERVALGLARRALRAAPVFMAPANCAEGTGWMLISGDPARHEALQSALKAMTGSRHDRGDDRVFPHAFPAGVESQRAVQDSSCIVATAARRGR
ncbi:MAG TPA: hypothetical protein VFU71_17745 [Burkholderiaceae bacterium]|nr:hypothetical protein [Burkholderiaceae bacterium]